MEKKEPTLSTQSSTHETKPSTQHAPARRDSKKSLKSRISSRISGRFSTRQKRIIAALVICAVLIGIMVWTISVFDREKSNVATLEPAKIERAERTNKTEQAEDVKKESWFSRLFKRQRQDMAAAETIAPSFDVARVENGQAVIAGRAGPGDLVYILEGGREIGTEKADENGTWAFIPKRPLPEGNRTLSLYVLDRDGNRINSVQNAIIRVTREGSGEVAVLMGGDQRSRVLQAPRGQDIGALRVEKIDYNDRGGFHAEGHADKGATVNVYLDGKLIGKAVAGASGLWSIDTDNIALSERQHRLRADQLGSNGNVVRRVEYRFTPVLIEGEGSMTVIKKGDNLWNIARREYGAGTRYVVIFEANRSQIKDPDLIFPGQVFLVPRKGGETYDSTKPKTAGPASAPAARPAQTPANRKVPISR